MGHTLRFEDGCVSRAQARRLRVNVDLIRRMRQAREREMWDAHYAQVEADRARMEQEWEERANGSH
jgi:hypothetical protein